MDIRHQLGIAGFVLLDALVTVGCLGFYHSDFTFDFTILCKNLFLIDKYQFVTSPFDFVVLIIFRFAFLIVANIALFINKAKKELLLLLLGAIICNASYSLVKLLAFSEIVEQLRYYGVWMSIGWNVISFSSLYALCSFLYKCVETSALNGNLSANYHHLQEDEPPPTSSRVGDVEEGVLKQSASTMRHILFVLKYSFFCWRWILVGFFFLLAYSVSRIFIPLYTAKVISLIVDSGKDTFIRSIIIMAILTTLSAIFGGLRGGIFSYTGALINTRIRKDLFASIVRQEIAFFDNAETGEILSRLTSDCQTVSTLISTNVNVFLRNVVMVIGSFVVMLTISWRLTLVTFIAIPPLAFFTKVFGIYFDRISEKTQKTIADSNKVAEEVISTMRTVRSFACETRECVRFEDRIMKTMSVLKNKCMYFTVYIWLNEFAANIVLIGVLCYGGYLVLLERMTTDGIIAFLLYQVQLGENFYNINYVFSGLMEGVGASRKVFEYLVREPKITPTGSLSPPNVEGKIEFLNVSFSYPSRPNNPALQDISFVARPGETVALVGPSGAGKSSIISLIEHFYESNTGQVMLDDILINQYDHVYYHQKVSLVAQEPILYAGSVRYNIMYGCDECVATEEKMMEAAKLANIHDFIMETENGYDTNCGEKGIQMSGGQKQRIAIARALIRDPAILILDEATSALDSESEYVIKEAIQKCSVGRTVIVIAHRLSTVENADRIIVIDKGRIVQMGTHQTLLADADGLYFSIAQKQLLGHSTDTNVEEK